VTESPNYFPRGPHVGQPYSTGFWPCHIILRFTHCLNFARHPLSRMKIKTKCFADTGTGLPHHKSMQSKGPKKIGGPHEPIITYSLAVRPGLLTALASLITDAYSSLLSVVCCHLLTFVSPISFSTSSSHLILGLAILLLPSGLLSNIFLNVLPRSILTTCPIHSNLFFLMSATMTRSLYSSLNSGLVLILYIPCSTTGPRILLNIFRSHVSSLVTTISLTAHVSLPNTTASSTIVLHILILTALLVALDPNICLGL